MSKLTFKLFNVLVAIVGKAKYNYTILVDYEGCKMLIRPFLFFEILMVSGVWEPYVKAILERELKKSDVVVDVGANIGAYAIPLAKKKVSKVIAFEPHPKTAEILEKNIKLNALDNILLVRKTVSDSKNRVLFRLSSEPLFSSIIGASTDIDSTVEIESVDLNSELAMESRVNWLIIDVEGSEINVLYGAREILEKYSPKIILESDNQNIYEVNKLLINEGYSITHIHGLYYHATKQ